MEYFSIKNYYQYYKETNTISALKDVSETYKLEATHQYHDKIFREVLDDKKEFINFVTKYLPYDQKENEIKETDIERYNARFITSSFTSKEADIIYKIKEEDVFFIIEHQSTIDYRMAERILEYCVGLMNSVTKGKGIPESYPLICPIVLYTGKRKWNAPLTISEIQKDYYGLKRQEYPRYNIVDVNNYTNKELIEERSAISKAMLFEKISTKEKLRQTINELKERGLTEDEKKYIRVMLMHSNDIKRKLNKEELDQYQKILEEGEDSMTNFEKLYIELIDEKRAKMKKAEKIGEKQEKRKIVSKMLKMNMSDEMIIKITEVDSENLEKIKQELKVG